MTPEQQASAEAFLVDHATRHDARDLAVLGRRLREVIAPEQADAHEGHALEAEERRAFTSHTEPVICETPGSRSASAKESSTVVPASGC